MDTAIENRAETAPKHWAFDRKLPLADQLYGHLRERIISLELPPGTSLSRNELSDFYRVSQTPLRDAILRLEKEGLVEIFPQSRTVVTRIDTGRVREDQFLRSAVETEIIALIAADPDKSRLAPVRDAFARQVAISDRNGDFQDFVKLDKAFHRQLFAAADKLGLYALIDERSGQLDRVRRFHLHLPDEGKMQQVIADHRAILAAVEAGDVEGARVAMRSHLSGTLSKLDELAARFPDSFG
ncbi:GntR family transcriptional regulator [Chelativorans alearense]|uniref:GntR family transcriptional regulator n=1 Tax=Chelativorans alearense TaxID=2681495 RepID=UPI0013D684EA|nr:GntR family transcriptional regulator [Chelativorans alearense]